MSLSAFFISPIDSSIDLVAEAIEAPVLHHWAWRKYWLSRRWLVLQDLCRLGDDLQVALRSEPPL